MLWTQKLNIHPILKEDNENSDESAVKVAKKLAEYLESNGFSPNVVKKLRVSKTQCEVNNSLKLMYDWADANRIWLGF